MTRLKAVLVTLALTVGILTTVTMSNPTTPQASALTGCFGPAFRQINGKSGTILQRYSLAPHLGVGVARVRVTLNSIYDHCPNKNRPRKIRPMAWQGCYTVVDYAVGTTADERDLREIFRRAWRKRFHGVLMDHIVYQGQGPGRKRTSPVARVVTPGGRHECTLFQESIDDRIWFRTLDGWVTLRFVATTLLEDDVDDSVVRQRNYHPLTNPKIPFVG